MHHAARRATQTTNIKASGEISCRNIILLHFRYMPRGWTRSNVISSDVFLSTSSFCGSTGSLWIKNCNNGKWYIMQQKRSYKFSDHTQSKFRRSINRFIDLTVIFLLASRGEFVMKFTRFSPFTFINSSRRFFQLFQVIPGILFSDGGCERS